MHDVEKLSPADLYSARQRAGVADPTIDETVIWYMELHPDANEAQVRAEIARRSKRPAEPPPEGGGHR